MLGVLFKIVTDPVYGQLGQFPEVGLVCENYPFQELSVTCSRSVTGGLYKSLNFFLFNRFVFKSPDRSPGAEKLDCLRIGDCKVFLDSRRFIYRDILMTQRIMRADGNAVATEDAIAVRNLFGESSLI